jgi:uncharacterized membrane protein
MTTLQDNLPATNRLTQDSDQHQNEQSPRPNISSTEQWTSLLVGSGLVLAGLKRFSLGGLVVAGAGAALINRGITKHCSLYEKMGIDTSDGPARPEAYFNRGIHVEQSYTINKDPMELYRYWRDFENLPKFMDHLQSVTKLDDKKSHWVVTAPAGHTVEWDAEIINDEPGRLIAWKSLENADVDNAGSVRFVPAPGNRGTEVKVVIDYIPPAGRVGAFVARLFGENPQQQIQEDLRHFKQIMEAGEVPTTEGQPRGTCTR